MGRYAAFSVSVNLPPLFALEVTTKALFFQSSVRNNISKNEASLFSLNHLHFVRSSLVKACTFSYIQVLTLFLCLILL